MDGLFSQFPYKCHLEEVASVGDGLESCTLLDSRVDLNHDPLYPLQEDEIDMVFDGMDSDCDGSLTMKAYAASERRGN